MTALLLVVLVAGIIQLATVAELGIRRICDAVERRVARWRAQPARVVIEMRPTSELVVVFWNGCALQVNRKTEYGRAAMAGALLLSFPWHRRPNA